MQNESDTLLYISQLNYSVKEISIEEYLVALTQLEETEDELIKNEIIKAKACLFALGI